MATTRITLEDVYRMAQVRDPVLSPDGTRVAFSMDTARRSDDDKIPSLYLLDLETGGEPHRLTRGAFLDSAPRWSPDGRYLGFLSNRPDELEMGVSAGKDAPPAKDDDEKEEPKSQVWVLDLKHGGEPRQVTRRKEGVTAFDWSPDGSRVVIESRDPSPEEEAYLKSIRDKKKPGPWVLTRVQHKHDGDGFLDTVKSHLFLVDVNTRDEKRLTAGPASESGPVWSPDGSVILFSSNRTGDADQNGRVDLWLIDPETLVVKRLTRGDVRAGNPVFSPDGREVAFLSPREPENAYIVEHVWVMKVADSMPVEALETCIGEGWTTVGGVVPDNPGRDPVNAARVYPVPREKTPVRLLTDGIPGPAIGLRWPEADRLVAMAGNHGQWRLLSIYRDGQYEFQAPSDRIGSLTGFDARGRRTVAVIDHPNTAQEIYRIDEGTAPIRVSHLHDAWLQGRNVADLRWIQYRDHDGVEVEALVVTPPGFTPEESGPAPLLVNIHGGPMAFDAPGFDFDAQYFAGLGYVVLQVNYRGSISYGEAYCQSIQGKWGPMEHDDVMCGVDEVIRQGLADPDRLYCTGFSQGGIMTNWAIGHTDRFRAAVTEHGMWNYESAFGTDDCHSWWQDDLGVPWQNPELYRSISPMSGVDQIRTPVLITAGELDWRCPLDQAEQLYMALRKRGVETALVVYPGEHHAITRPTRAIDRLTRLQGWLGRYDGLKDPDAAADKA